MAFIYVLKDRKTDEVRYVGKANNIDKRLASHLRDSKRRDYPLYRWIRKNGVPIIEAITGDIENWQDAEREAILKYKEKGCRLLNVAEGGDEPFCDMETRRANGPKAAIVRETGKNARLNVLKRDLGKLLKDGYVSLSTQRKMAELARKHYNLFPQWLELGED